MEANKFLTAVLYGEDDAKFFLKSKPNVNQVLPITPNAQAVLIKSDFTILNTTDVYTDFKQARVLAHTRRIEKKFLSFLNERVDLGLSEKETLENKVHVLISISASIWELVKDLGSCLLPVGKKWVLIDDPHEIHENILKCLRTNIQKSLFPDIGEPFSHFLVKKLNSFACSFWSKRTVIGFSDFDYGLNQIPKHEKFKMYALSIRLSDGNWKDLFNSFKFLLETLINKKNCTLLIVPEYCERSASACRGVLEKINDPISLIVIKIFFESLIETIAYLAGSKTEILNSVGKIKIIQVLAGQLRWEISTAFAEVCKKLNIPVTLISHGSHTIPDSSISSYAKKRHASGLLFSSLSSSTVLQSPAAESYFYHLKYKEGHRSEPIQWAIGKNHYIAPNSKMRYILHAGTYKQWISPRPWIYETPDEFIKGLKSLIFATSRIKNTKLVIRIRPTEDCKISSLQKLLPNLSHYEIKSSGPILDDFSKADLLVSWSSTTIEEIFHFRKPVLLWGGSQRYMHLPPFIKLPTPQNRGAVYAPAKDSELPKMIEAILESHIDQPLTDEELNGYVWTDNFFGVDQFVENFCNS